MGYKEGTKNLLDDARHEAKTHMLINSGVYRDIKWVTDRLFTMTAGLLALIFVLLCTAYYAVKAGDDGAAFGCYIFTFLFLWTLVTNGKRKHDM